MRLKIIRHDAASKTRISVLMTGSYFIGLIIALSPRTQSKLKILEPITLATAMSVFFFIAATAEVTSSGKEVPMATIVSPIKFWLRPNCSAIAIAPSTTHFPPKKRATIPKEINKMDLPIGNTSSGASSTISALPSFASFIMYSIKRPKNSMRTIPSN